MNKPGHVIPDDVRAYVPFPDRSRMPVRPRARWWPWLLLGAAVTLLMGVGMIP